MDINERREALRARVRQQLHPEPEEEEELVVQASEITNSTTEGEELLLIEEQNGILALASSLIFIGSVLGIITGLLLLQGNPSELLDQSAGEDVIDVYGIVLEAETGEAIEGVYVDLINAQTKESIQKVETNSYGYYEFQNVVSKEHVLRVTLENYSTIERTFAPDSATQAPFTLSKGNELLEEDLTLSTSGWSLQNAVALSTGIALVTILAGIIGLNEAVNARRATNYRRTQYLAGFALFSRGFIVFGPFLILCGMGLLIFARDEFQKQRWSNVPHHR